MTTASSVVRIFVTLCLVCSVAGAAGGGATGVGIPGQLPGPIGLCDTTPGDVYIDGSVDITDITQLISFLRDDDYVDLTPEQIANSDVNAECLVNRADVDYLIAYLYEDGPAPLPCVCAEPAVTACRGTQTGDVYIDGSVDITDITQLISFLRCDDDVDLTPEQRIQADVNGDCVVDLADAYYLIAYLYEDGPAPVPCMCVEKENSPCWCTQTGNVYNDATIDITDITQLISFLNCMTGLTDEQLIQADVNGDCAVDLADAYYLIAYLYEDGPAPVDCLCVEKEVPVCP
ncbi:MAG: hypothetical protein GY856_07665 [bacterium]|nr:hypothetical protein [bacterium]